MRGILRAASVLVPLGLLLLPPAQATLPGLEPIPGDPTPNAPNAVTAQYEIRLLPSLEAFQVRATLNVLEAQLANRAGTPAQTIRDAGAPVHEQFEQTVRTLVEAELTRAFPESKPHLEELRFDYGSTDLDTDPYRPGIGVVLSARVPLTPALLGLPSAHAAAGPDLVRAFLYSGGSMTLDRSLAIQPGFDARIAVSVPDFLRLDAPGRDNATRLVFPRNNTAGAVPAALPLVFDVALQPSLVPANVRAGPRVEATFYADDETPLWLQAIPFTKGRYSADLDLRIQLPSLETSLFEESPLPAGLHLERVSADLLRIAFREGLLDEAQIHLFFATLITDSLEEGFGKAAEVRMDEEAFRQSLQAPIGGPDGATVAPLIIHAQAHLPLKGEKMLFASSMGRTLGMVTGVPGSFPLKNEGEWTTQITLLYPKGVDVDAKDSAHKLHEVQTAGRQGFTVELAQGDSTEVHVYGRPPFDAAVFAIGLLELILLAFGSWWTVQTFRHRRAARRTPWAPR